MIHQIHKLATSALLLQASVRWSAIMNRVVEVPLQYIKALLLYR